MYIKGIVLGRTKISRHFLAAPTAACDERGLQQGFVKDEMGFRGQLHGNNFEPPMSQLGQMRTKSNVRITSASLLFCCESNSRPRAMDLVILTMPRTARSA